MKIYPDTKVYVACPANIHADEPELMHQLCSLLIRYGIDAYMLYMPPRHQEFNLNNPIDDAYRKYCVPYVFEAEDKPNNVVVLFETIGDLYSEYKQAQKVFWWCSVDNYLNSISNTILERKENPLAEPLQNFFFFQASEKKTEHWVQSEYARQFVALNGIPEKEIAEVGDYLSPIFLSKASSIELNQKKDIIVYNPHKGIEFTRKLMAYAPYMDWRPIQDMTAEQVQELLASAKVYIDFGNHPSKDRLPREAAISGCVVITSKNGAAANDIDINIPAEFKFDDGDENILVIVEKIRDIFQNFKTAYNKQFDYRKKISKDKRRFEKEIEKIFGIKSPPKVNTVALGQSYTQKSFLLAQLILQNDSNLKPSFLIDDWHGQNLSFEGELISRADNRNYFRVIHPDTNEEIFLPIVTMDEAKFLYLEGRIAKFAFLQPDLEELKPLVVDFQLKNGEDIIAVNLNDV